MDPASSSSPARPPMSKLKVGGAWSGTIEVDLEEWTFGKLREELAMRSKCPPESLNIICSGKNLKSGLSDTKLSSLGLRPNSRILLNKTSLDEAKVLNDELEAQNRLARITAAVQAMAKRHTDNSFPVDDFNIELENQSGQKMIVGSETEQRAVLMGLMLHAKGQNLIKKGLFKDALDILVMSEDAFHVCHTNVLEMVDNIYLLEIDIVWCHFMLRDISSLEMAGIRLERARKGLLHCYGTNMERARVLQGGFCPELAIFTRLELLEGVVAYHSGLWEEARKALTSAQSKYQQLQVSDEALCTIANLGFTTKQARRALRMCGQNIELAINFAIEEKDKALKKRIENLEHERMIREQKSYGKTPLRKAVDMTKLADLVSIGYEKCLAAEALRKNENDMERALDELSDPLLNSALQSAVDSKRKKRKFVPEEHITELVSMGFERAQVEKALSQFDSKEEAINFLLRDHCNSDASANAASQSHVGGDLPKEERDAGREQENVQERDSGSASSLADREEENVQERDSRDEEIEYDIANSISGDPLADYDIEVEEEGKAISEYLSLLSSAI